MEVAFAFAQPHGLGSITSLESIVLSADYHLAPQNRLPIGYDDCFSSLECLCNNASSDPWLIKQADLSPIVSFWR
ncbi:hypothetical protein NC653_039185 [Populus alba x Populus x berolinensis]|uniref:Alpha/beta hydrolase fold-3 domain-containing protein n=1 Tax=Populus alba x Populus x berolinensis TaxID=444605 RepID=A0AAD6PRU1_9ROSI|nr:hypothetical protein NC653_039185 [Populus alba x Populus x berolinensis]